MSLMRIAIASPTSAPSTKTGVQTSCPPRIAGVIIGPQQPGAEFQTMWPPSATGPSHRDVRAEQAVGEGVHDHRRRAVVLLDRHAVLRSAAGDRQQQRDLLAVGQDLVAGHVLARHDREHRAQRGRELRLVVGEPREEIGDGGALGHLDTSERRGREARESCAEADTYRHPSASLTARREKRRDVSGVAAARATTWRGPTISVASFARVIAV